MNSIVNYHVVDSSNIGDLLSSPLRYFDFPDFEVETRDIRHLNCQDATGKYIIVGGGGLLFSRFNSSIRELARYPKRRAIVAWGVGLQNYRKFGKEAVRDSSDLDCLEGFNLTGVRDVNTPYRWVPCVSCMHPAFNQYRTPQHEFVVFSHKKFQLNIDNFPRMTNDAQSFGQVLDFLGSGETILTSSFHGAYWGILLGRKVLAFPFSSKFYTLKHPPAVFPVKKWRQRRTSFEIFGKVLYELRDRNTLTCRTDGWQQALAACKTYPDSLDECRLANREYYADVLSLFNR